VTSQMDLHILFADSSPASSGLLQHLLVPKDGHSERVVGNPSFTGLGKSCPSSAHNLGSPKVGLNSNPRASWLSYEISFHLM
jgi:hypothetical protein